ncbi:MAG: hypothetical protein RL311_152 [Bacteroidota bacterium]|jgi:hypothetical protein
MINLFNAQIEVLSLHKPRNSLKINQKRTWRRKKRTITLIYFNNKTNKQKLCQQSQEH